MFSGTLLFLGTYTCTYFITILLGNRIIVSCLESDYLGTTLGNHCTKGS